jgi:cation/acetate symporter
MELQYWIWIAVGLSFTLYITIAIITRASSTGEFYIAGKGVPPIANGMATAADWMSAASFISMAGIISFNGYDGSVYLMGWTGGYVLLALLLAPYLRKFGKFTVPDFIGDRYYSNVARGVAVFCALIVSFTYIAGQMRGVGVVFSRYLEVDITTGVLIGMLIVLFYAVLGGMKGITYTQVAQYCVLIFAFMLPAIFISLMVTGNVIPQIGFGSAGSDGVYLLDKLDGLHRELNPRCLLYHCRSDGGHCWITARYCSIFYGKKSERRPKVSRMGLTFYRHFIHHSSCSGCIFENQLDRNGKQQSPCFSTPVV